jgi:acyl-CoA thioester hydrolase
MIHHEYKIYYEDTDSGGVVYYANYLKFLERSRTDLLSSVAISQIELGKSNIFFVVKKCEIEYISSAKLEDIISVSTKISKIGKASIEFFQEIFIKEKKIVNANIKIACVTHSNTTFKPIIIPSDILTKIQKIIQ